MSEYSPPTRKVRMTRSQMKKYLEDMKKAREIAQAKMDEAKKSGEFFKEDSDIAKLEEKLNDDDIFVS